MMKRCKKQKVHERQNEGEGKDIISNLPNCIIEHILSFLPTNDAVGFCALSSQWKRLWTSLPNIEFDDLLFFGEMSGWYPADSSDFIDFVERVLVHHDMSKVKKFRLSCRVFFNAFCVSRWVSIATWNTIQELDLCLFVDADFMLPCWVFTCQSLASLKIEMNCVLELPTCISLPHLRSLRLRFITFSDDKLTQNLLCSCPVLEELAILDCEWMGLKSITISIPTLKTLTIVELPCFGSIYLDDCEIKIYAPNLESFSYSGGLSNDIFLYNLSSLAVVSINIPNLCGRKSENANRAAKLLSGLHNANCGFLMAPSSHLPLKELCYLSQGLSCAPIFLLLRSIFYQRNFKDRWNYFASVKNMHLYICEDIYRPAPLSTIVVHDGVEALFVEAFALIYIVTAS